MKFTTTTMCLALGLPKVQFVTASSNLDAAKNAAKNAFDDATKDFNNLKNSPAHKSYETVLAAAREAKNKVFETTLSGSDGVFELFERAKKLVEAVEAAKAEYARGVLSLAEIENEILSVIPSTG